MEIKYVKRVWTTFLKEGKALPNLEKTDYEAHETHCLLLARVSCELFLGCGGITDSVLFTNSLAAKASYNGNSGIPKSKRCPQIRRCLYSLRALKIII